jgi:hypothetical protein
MSITKAGIQNNPCESRKVYRYKEDIIMWNILIGESYGIIPHTNSTQVSLTSVESYNILLQKLIPHRSPPTSQSPTSPPKAPKALI